MSCFYFLKKLTVHLSLYGHISCGKQHMWQMAIVIAASAEGISLFGDCQRKARNYKGTYISFAGFSSFGEYSNQTSW